MEFDFDDRVKVIAICNALGLAYYSDDDTLERIGSAIKSVSAELDKAGVPQLGSLLERVRFLADQLPNYPLIPDPSGALSRI